MRFNFFLACFAVFFSVGVALCASSSGFTLPSFAIFSLIRLPQIWLAGLVGLALGVSGAASQGLLRNPLADPFILGMSGAAALGSVCLSVFFPTLPFRYQVLGTAGSTLFALVFLFSSLWKRHPDQLLLMGVVFNSFSSSLISVIKTVISPTEAQSLLYWMIGQIQIYPVQDLCIASMVIIFASAWLFTQASALDRFSLGEEIAKTMGVSTTRLRYSVYLALTFLVGVVVSMSGMIGFVGLMVPHAVRLQNGPMHRNLLLQSGLWGIALVVLADACSRFGFVYLRTELPAGVFTTLIGAPYFIWAIANRQKARR